MLSRRRNGCEYDHLALARWKRLTGVTRLASHFRFTEKTLSRLRILHFLFTRRFTASFRIDYPSHACAVFLFLFFEKTARGIYCLIKTADRNIGHRWKKDCTRCSAQFFVLGIMNFRYFATIQFSEVRSFSSNEWKYVSPFPGAERLFVRRNGINDI